MSYLDVPRLHFAGQFRADPSTVNNSPLQYADNVEPDYSDPNVGEWNPYGTGTWRLHECVVTRGVFGDGTIAASSKDDPIVGMSLSDADSRPPAKIVDLDPQQQAASQIWGLQVQLGRPGARAFSGEFLMAAFVDLWGRAPGQGFKYMGACWQSVLTDVQWGDLQGSRLLADIKSASAAGMLSIKFNVDGFDGADVGKSPTFGLGRIVGSIGISRAREPARYVAGRHCSPVNPRGFNFFPAIVDKSRGKLVADLGNAVPTTKPGGLSAALPALQLGFIKPDNSFSSLGTVDTADPGWYANTAGIVEVPPARSLTADELSALASRPIAIGLPTQGATKLLAQEPADGLYVRAEQYVFRQSPGESATVELRSFRFGQPLPNAAIVLTANPTLLPAQVDDSGDPAVGTPAAALNFPSQVKTDADGSVHVVVACSNPAVGGKPPRGALDGQLYAIAYSLADAQQTSGTNFNPNCDFVSLLLWNAFPVPGSPTWLEHIQPILRQYAFLYPVMKPILDLSDYASVVKHKRILVAALSLPMSDPNFMPVTRDLSLAKRDAILKWLGPLESTTPPAEGSQPGKAQSLTELARMKSGRFG